MKNYFRVGQTVYDVRFGKGIVVSASYTKEQPIRVKFCDQYETAYTVEGKSYEFHSHPSLYQNPIVTIPNDPFEEFEKGELVWVTHDTKIWEIRFYSHFEDGEHHCFKAQQIEGLTNVWKHVRKFNDNPLIK